MNTASLSDTIMEHSDNVNIITAIYSCVSEVSSEKQILSVFVFRVEFMNVQWYYRLYCNLKAN